MKKSVKRLMSAFMALAMVLSLGMSLGGVTASATEVEEVTALEDTAVQPAASARTVAYSGSNWAFKHQRDTGDFTANAGQSATFAITNVHSDSSLGFNVTLCKYVNGQAQVVGGPISIDANPNNTSIAFEIDSTGTYFFRCQRTNDGVYQYIGTVKVVVLG